MSKIETNDILRLGMLARIGIDEDLAKALAPQLLELLGYVAKLQEADTTAASVTVQVGSSRDIWRDDEVKPSKYSRDELLANAPQTKDGYIKVRRVL